MVLGELGYVSRRQEVYKYALTVLQLVQKDGHEIRFCWNQVSWIFGEDDRVQFQIKVWPIAFIDHVVTVFVAMLDFGGLSFPEYSHCVGCKASFVKQTIHFARNRINLQQKMYLPNATGTDYYKVNAHRMFN